MSNFDATALYGVDQSFDHDDVVVQADEGVIRNLVSGETRRRCSSIKLASRVVGMAIADAGDASDSVLIQYLSAVMARVSTVRQVAIGAVGVTKESPDFVQVFNALTNTALDFVTEEWKWKRLFPGRERELEKDVLARYFNFVVSNDFEMLQNDYEMHDIAITRILCRMEIMPKILGLVNFFDYYQTDHEVFTRALLTEVVNGAERQAHQLIPHSAVLFTKQAILQRLYGVSVGLMCELYKHHAAQDVEKLRSMESLGRSYTIAQFERVGGMSYEHIIRSHAQCFERVAEISGLVMDEFQRKA